MDEHAETGHGRSRQTELPKMPKYVDPGHSQEKLIADDLFEISSLDEHVETGHSRSRQTAAELPKMPKFVDLGHSQEKLRSDDLFKISSQDENVDTGHSQLRQRVIYSFKNPWDKKVGTGHRQ